MRVAILVGGALGDSKRVEVQERRRARIDVLELQDRLHAELFEFGTLERTEKSGVWPRLLLRIARKTGLWSLCLAVLAAPRLRTADVVYLSGEDVGLALALVCRALRISSPRLVMRMEQPTYGRTLPRRLVYQLYMQATLPRVSRVLCRTTAHAHYLTSVLHVPFTRVAVIPETVDTTFFDASPTANRSVPLIVSAGLEERDYATLTEAVRGLAVEAVIGAGSPWAHATFEIDSAIAPGNVTVATFNPEQMRALYAQATVVVVPLHPTLRACGISVVLEAWASRRPVIVTRTAGQLDYGRDGETVLFVAPHDSNDLRGRIKSLLEAPARAAELARAGRMEVEAKLNLDAFLDCIERELLPGTASC